VLEKLPFPPKLKRVPEYAGGHHERMDGRGYPKGLTRDEMSIPARIMGVADVFEALTAKERPYKPPMPLSQAFSILRNMKEEQHIDPDVFELFLTSGVWKQYAKEHMLPEQMDVTDVKPYLESAS
jgi:HD-GYP domain-containing protein (c-di-GMP phosphodiesterase class II)